MTKITRDIEIKRGDIIKGMIGDNVEQYALWEVFEIIGDRCRIAMLSANPAKGRFVPGFTTTFHTLTFHNGYCTILNR